MPSVGVMSMAFDYSMLMPFEDVMSKPLLMKRAVVLQ
jgi:hypothetical protein